MTTDAPTTVAVNPRPLISAGTMLGIGMGGFIDGILFHQLLQIHNMLSARRPPDSVVSIEINMFWDGLFHAFTWLMTAIGIAMLFRAARRPEVPWSGRTLVGAMLLGWGLFNLVEGLLDHHILQIHHVYQRAGGVSVWDWLFLALGLLLVVVGLLLIRGDGAAPRPAVQQEPDPVA